MLIGLIGGLMAVMYIGVKVVRRNRGEINK